MIHFPPRLYGTLYILLIPFFAGIYYFLPRLNKTDLTIIDAIYFSAVTITTLGYGDIFPSTQYMRFFTACESLLGIFTIGIFLSSIAEKKSIKIAKEQMNWLTGGNSIPWLSFSNNGFNCLAHFKGEYPIYDLNIELQEYWLPIDDERLPDNYFKKMQNEYPDIPEMVPFKTIDHYIKPIMLPIRIDGPFDRFIFNPDKMLFPETKKFMLVASFSARNGNFTQYIAGKIDSVGNRVFQTMLIDNEGKRHRDDGNWVNVKEVNHPRGNKKTLDYFVYNWKR